MCMRRVLPELNRDGWITPMLASYRSIFVIDPTSGRAEVGITFAWALRP